MRHVPWATGRRTSKAIVVPDHGTTLTGLGPVAASAILSRWKSGAVELGASENVVHVRTVARGPGVHPLTLFVERMLVVDSTVVVVQVVGVGPDYETLGVGPGAISDTVAGVDSRLSAGRLRAQIGSPRPVAGAHRLAKLLTVRVRTVPALDLGGGVELYPSERTFARVDVSNLLLRYPGPAFTRAGDAVFDEHFWRANPRFGMANCFTLFTCVHMVYQTTVFASNVWVYMRLARGRSA